MSTIALLDFPLPFDSIADAMTGSSASAHLYLALTVTDPVDGALILYWSDSSFQADNLPSGPRVYPVIHSWGPMRKMLTLDGETRDGDFQVRLHAAASFTPSNKTKSYTIYQLFQSATMQGAEVTVFQWSQDSSVQVPVWHGYLTGIADGSFQEGVLLVTVQFSSIGTGMLAKIGPIIGTDIYLTAPKESQGRMPAEAYGKFTTSMATDGEVSEAMFLGYRSQFVEGVRTAEDNASALLSFEFARADGGRAAAKANVGTAGDPSRDSCLWLYFPEADHFGMMDASDFTLTNDTTSLRATFNVGCRVWTPIFPESVGPLMHAGFWATAYKITNDDPNDFLQTTSTDYTIAFNVPRLPLSGFRCEKAIVMVDVEGESTGGASTRTFDFGLWDAQRDANRDGIAEPNWWGPAGTKGTKTINVGTGATARARFFMRSGTVLQFYTPVDGSVELGASSTPEFYDGNFIGKDLANNTQPIQAVLSVTSASKDKIKLYGMSVVLVGTPGLYGNRIVPSGKTTLGIIGHMPFPFENQPMWGYKQGYMAVPDTSKPKRSVKVLATGWFQKDTGSTYEGGAADDTIECGSGIAHHLLRNMNPNQGGTVGNFPDARSENIAGEKSIRIAFGSDPVNYREAIDQLQKSHPVRVHDEDGARAVIYEEMNPHPSRQYRSSADVVKIMGRDIEPGSFRYTAGSLEGIVNTVRVNYGQGYQSDRPLGSQTYLNPLSRELYGAREELSVDAPWIGRPNVTSAQWDVPAFFMARFLGRRAGRSRIPVTCTLPQSYSDLKRGNVTEFGEDMESFGLYCLAHRCGKVDYVLAHSGATSNAANNKTAEIVALTTGETYIGFSQQVDGLDYAIGVAGSYTNVANPWQYSSNEGGWYDFSPAQTWAAFSNVVNPHGFKSTGIQRTSWDRPALTSWKKTELLFGGTYVAGPCYWARYQYSAASVHAVLSDVFSYPARWCGRPVEVIDVTRKLGSYGDYPAVEVVLQETM